MILVNGEGGFDKLKQFITCNNELVWSQLSHDSLGIDGIEMKSISDCKARNRNCLRQS